MYLQMVPIFAYYVLKGFILCWLEYIADSCIWWGKCRGVQGFIANDSFKDLYVRFVSHLVSNEDYKLLPSLIASSF